MGEVGRKSFLDFASDWTTAAHHIHCTKGGTTTDRGDPATKAGGRGKYSQRMYGSAGDQITAKPIAVEAKEEETMVLISVDKAGEEMVANRSVARVMAKRVERGEKDGK